MDYKRPELTIDEIDAAEKKAKSIFRQYGLNGLVKALADLVVENMRLLKEINEHRQARGIDPLPVHKV